MIQRYDSLVPPGRIFRNCGSEGPERHHVDKIFQVASKFFSKNILEEKMAKRIIAKEDTLSNWLGISGRRIREVCKEAKVDTGKYNLEMAIKIYIESLKGTGKDEMAELRRADRELKEYKLSMLKRETVPLEHVKLAIADMQYRTKAKAMSIPVKASLELLGKDNRKEIEVILKRHINGFLNEMSNMNLEEETDEMGQ